MQLARIEHRPRCFDCRDDERLCEHLLPQKATERRVSRHLCLDDDCFWFEIDVRSVRNPGRRCGGVLAARGHKEHAGEEKDDTSPHGCRGSVAYLLR
jgi:hypothetical protein